MFRFFRDRLEADKTERILGNLGVEVKVQCGCVHDHRHKECQTPDEACHYGTYLTVSELYAPTLNIIAEQVKYTQLIYKSENCGVPAMKDIGGRCF